MDPIGALPPALGPALLAALPAQVSEDQVRALLAQLGQNLDLVLFASTGDTVKLRMSTGQVFEAEGQLPYPVGTLLTVQVQAPATDGGAPRLKLIEATPPSAPAILAPLLQGEAAPLMARLVQPEVPEELRPLLRLLETLQDPAVPQAPPASRILAALETLPAPALQALRQLAPAPTTLPELAQAVRAWIGNALSELAAAPPSGLTPSPSSPGAPATPVSQAPTPGSPPPLTQTVAPAIPQAGSPSLLPSSLAPTEPEGPPVAPTSVPATVAAVSPGGPTTQEATPPRAPANPLAPSAEAPPAAAPLRPVLSPGKVAFPALLPAETEEGPKSRAAPVPLKGGTDLAALLILRLETQLAADRSDTPAEARDPLRALVRQLLQGLEAPSSTRSDPTHPIPGKVAVPLAPGAAQTPAEGARPGENLPSPAAAPSKGAPPVPLELPESWENWISGAMKALGDPKVSPREAPFHLAQAREGTAFFELPLPWGAPNAPLQIWVESGLPDGGDGRSAEETPRVLMGLSFTALGETRVGVQQSRAALQVRIWTERPELLKDRLSGLQRELEDGERTVDLRIIPLGDGQARVPSLRTVLAGSGFQALG